MQEQGDLSWIVPNKIIAFPSPVSAGFARAGRAWSPEFLVEIFEENNIGAVIRLNDRLYKEEVLEKEGIKVYDLEFPDGSCPSDDIITRFISIVESQVRQRKAVAVHCRAGLGRTGTLIGCYIMSKHR